MAKRLRKKVSLKHIEMLAPTTERVSKGDLVQGRENKIYRSTTILEQEFNRKAINETQFNAGTKFRDLWENAGLSPHFGSVDLNRVGGGETSYGMPINEHQATCRALYRSATAMLVKEYLCVVQDVILNEKPLVEVGRNRFGWKDERQARATALSFLWAGLNALHFHWTREKR